jgi:UTP--glucose-1-phosphate uridylyltransferase
MKIRKAVIPAAGLGTRLLPLTSSQPKEMLPLGRKPVIQYVIEEIQSVGIEHVLIITTESKKLMEDYLSRSDFLSGEVFLVRQKLGTGMPYGLAYAIGLSEGFIGDEPFVVCLGDCIVKSKSPEFLLKRLIRSHKIHKASATIAFEEVPPHRVNKYGIAEVDGIIEEEFCLRNIVEKPPVETAPSNLAVAARYVFEPEIFSHIKNTQPGIGGEFQITDSIRSLLRAGNSVWGVKLKEDELRYDIGNFIGYFRAFFDFSLDDEDFGEEFKSYVREKMLK